MLTGSLPHTFCYCSLTTLCFCCHVKLDRHNFQCDLMFWVENNSLEMYIIFCSGIHLLVWALFSVPIKVSQFSFFLLFYMCTTLSWCFTNEVHSYWNVKSWKGSDWGLFWLFYRYDIINAMVSLFKVKNTIVKVCSPRQHDWLCVISKSNNQVFILLHYFVGLKVFLIY